MAFCFLQHENEISVPDIVQYGGNTCFDDEFSMKWFYIKFFLFILSLIFYIAAFILYGIEYGFGWWFTYYIYCNFTFILMYFIISLIITIKIYRYAKNNELPSYLKKRMIQSFQLTNDEDDNENDDIDIDPIANPSMRELGLNKLSLVTSILQYISLIGSWNAFILFWLHEFEVNIYNNQSSSQKFIVIITQICIQLLISIDFYMSGFRTKYKGCIYPLIIMLLCIVLNAMLILNNNLNESDFDQHLFTDLDWDNSIKSSIITCVWAVAVLFICSTILTMSKNICLCKWSLKQRRNATYPRAQERLHDDQNL